MKKVHALSKKISVEFSFNELAVLEDILLEEIRRLFLLEMPSVLEEEILEKVSSILNKMQSHDTRNKKQ